MKPRGIILVVLVLALLLAAGYVGAGMVIYNQLSDVSQRCSGPNLQNTPASFAIQNMDTSALLMPDYQAVTFPSRDPAITISAWYIPADGASTDTPTVILVHGLRSCKHNPEELLPAGMLHHSGISVLMIDLRDHGESTVEDGRFAGGTEEFRDALGAWDWLVNEKGIPPERIGLFGTSLGAATVMIAAGEEPRVAAVWEDSGFADVNVAIRAELARNGFPTFLASAAPLVSQLVSGDTITAYSPLQEVSKLNGRPLFITHGDADTRLSVQYAYDLAEAVRASGGEVEPWIAPGSGHVRAMFDYPEEYERRLTAFFHDYLGG